MPDALQELTECKRQREWAFGERDRIVSERDNVRIVCDQLRLERDGAVTDLFSALRDCNDIRRQKNDAVRELKEFRCGSFYEDCILMVSYIYTDWYSIYKRSNA